MSAQGNRVREWMYESRYVLLNDKNKKVMKDLLLASSALPIIYPNKQIEDDHYVDGGFLDNNPIRPLVDIGLKEIVVVHLMDNNEEEKKHWKQSIQGINTEGITFHHVYPSEPFSVLDVVLVNKVMTLGRIQLGNEDAKEQLKIEG